MGDKMNYAWPVTSENTVVLSYFIKKTEKIFDEIKDKKIAIFGAGIRGCCLLKILQRYGLSDFIFVDNNVEKQGNLIYDYDIISFEDSINIKEKKIYLVAPEGAYSIYNQLSNAGMIENKEWYSFSVSAYDKYVDEYIREMKKDYLLAMGDCAFTHVALCDKNPNSLGMMIRDTAGADRCKVLDMHGMGQQAFYHISRALIERGEKPAAFCLLLMIETFAPKVPIMPRTQHPELIRKLVENTKEPLAEFVDYVDLTKERFNRFQLEAFSSFEDKESQIKEKLHMEVNYLFKFRESAEGVTYFMKTIRMMNENNIPVVLYIPPVNTYLGERLFGADFKERYEVNFNRLYDMLDKEGLKYSVADASYLLDLDDFADYNTIDETCKYSGRLKLIDFLKENEVMKGFLCR